MKADESKKKSFSFHHFIKSFSFPLLILLEVKTKSIKRILMEARRINEKVLMKNEHQRTISRKYFICQQEHKPFHSIDFTAECHLPKRQGKLKKSKIGMPLCMPFFRLLELISHNKFDRKNFFFEFRFFRCF